MVIIGLCDSKKKSRHFIYIRDVLIRISCIVIAIEDSSLQIESFAIINCGVSIHKAKLAL